MTLTPSIFPIDDFALNEHVTLKLEYMPATNKTLAINGIPLLRRVSITVDKSAPEPTSPMQVRLTASYEESLLFEPVEIEIASIHPGQSQEIDITDRSRVKPRRLPKLTESTEATLRLQVKQNGKVGGKVTTVRILAPNEWFNSAPYYQSLVAFSQPNDDAVTTVLHDAMEILTHETGSGSMQGYQAGTDRAIQIGGAIFNALRQRNIRYINPPASFENSGQKIRSSTKVLSDQMGTCIDLAVTYAAIAEQAGLHPAIFILQGHAMAGIYTSEEPALRPVLYEEAEILNAVRSRRVIPVETVSYTADTNDSFTDAVSNATETLRRTDTYGLISVRDSRRDGMRPITSSISPETSLNSAASPTPIQPPKLDVSKVVDKFGSEATNQPTRVLEHEEVPARIAQWKKELLDLSFNNRLLNLRPGREVLPLEMRQGMLSELDDMVHDNASITISPHDEVTENRRLQGYASIRDFETGFVMDDLINRNRVYTDISTARYKGVFTHLRREVRTLLEETGSANLYLTLGSMTLDRGDGTTAEAPLFLVPITLSNRSGRSHYEISVDTSQPASPNYCLVEWLRQRHGIDIDALAQPPLDHSGLDIDSAIIQISHELLQANLPFSVSERANIIIAKFSTYGMWKDLNENWKHFMQTPVFRHITLTPGTSFDDPAGNENLLDVDVVEEELPLPIPADGAQLKAITAAGEGRSFVLEGPPGTGKSQTITNLVSHCMALGKTVLFVAEKQAALEVVAERLGRVGLAPFTLNLHGSDQSPASIREQLKETIDAEARYDGLSWEFATKELAARLQPLSQYPGSIHEPNAVGHSLWTAAAAKSHAGSGATLFVDDHYVRTAPLPQEELIESAKTLAGLVPIIGSDMRSRWGLVGDAAVEMGSPEFYRAWEQLEDARSLLQQHPDLLHLLNEAMDPEELVGALERFRSIPQDKRIGSTALASANSVMASLRALQTQLTTLITESTQIREIFSPIFISDGNHHQLLEAADAADKGFFGKKKRLAAYADLLFAAVHADQRNAIDIDSTHAPERIRPLILLIDPIRNQAQRLREAIAGIPEIADLASKSPVDPQILSDLQLRIQQLEYQLQLNETHPWLQQLQSNDLQGLISAATEVPQAWQHWKYVLSTTDELLAEWTDGRSWLDAWLSVADSWAADIDQLGVVILRRTSQWQLHSLKLRQAGLHGLLAELEAGSIAVDDTELAVIRGIADASIRERIAAFRLEGFQNHLKSEQLTALTKAMEKVRKEAVKALPAQLLARRPYRPGRIEGKVGELRRLLEAQRKARSFRSLFVEYGDEIQDVAPCFFVSPASLATYIEPGSNLFDVVVFDEASQITVDQAMGALGRAKSAIIVGDSKQMPPTRIGKTNLDDNDFEDEFEGPEDLESILAEAVESQIPRLWLTWHYRSQDESLIAFSNSQYYEGKLASLPSPGSVVNAGVELRRVDGHFQRTRGKRHRTNVVEAEAIVEEITSRLNHPLTSDESIGVVTFNMQQRNLVLDLLESSEDPLVEAALVQQDDPIFVKNLENVQGDERDVILFSTAFSAKEDGGRMPLNFGPLSRKGGEKRLNVAITRARRNVVLFSSFDPHEIDLNRTKSKGMADLRAYMELARDGAEQTTATSGLNIDENVIRDQIANMLYQRGWEVETSYGLSSFTLDLVVRPRGAKQWHIAIVLDSPRWAEMPTVADRDLTPELLSPLMSWAGVVRVWLPEWLHDADATILRIEQELGNAAENIRQQNARRMELEAQNEVRLERIREEARDRAARERAAQEAALIEMEATSTDNVDEIEFEELVNDLLDDSPATPSPQLVNAIEWDIDESARGQPSSHVAPLEMDQNASQWESERADTFRYIELEPISLGEREELSSGLSKQRLQECKRRIEEQLINPSGPVLLSSLQSIIARSFGRQKTSKSVNKSIERMIPPELIKDDGTGSKFVWPRAADPATWSKFRASDGARRMDDIPLIEIENAMRHINRTIDIADDEDLFRKTLQFFGLQRLTNNTSDRLARAKQNLGSSGAS